MNLLLVQTNTQNKYFVSLHNTLLHEDVGCGVSAAAPILKLLARRWCVVILCALATTLAGDDPVIPMAYEAGRSVQLPLA